jgi:hypothetical protein
MTYARCMAAVEVSVVLLGPENQRWRPMYPAQAIGHPGWHAEEAVQPELLVTIKSICGELRRVPDLLEGSSSHLNP